METLFHSLGIRANLVLALEQESICIPTEVQNKVIPQMLKQKDIIAQSATGTGKTLAYLLPLFEMLDPTKAELQAMILVPTHELAIQVLRVMEMLAKHSGIALKALPIIGHVNITRQIENLKEKPHVIVGSPGRILELTKKRKISAHTIKTLILDEADRLFDPNNVESALAVIKTTQKERQLLLFSASITQETQMIAQRIMKNPVLLKVDQKSRVPDTIQHCYLLTENRDKPEVLRKLLKIMQPQKTLVFINKTEDVQVLLEKLNYHKIACQAISGMHRKLERKQLLEDFKKGKITVLLATELAARGLDFEAVTHVFNVDVPESADNYLHRVGRTGRNGNAGMAINIVTERDLSLIRLYEKKFDIQINEIRMHEGKIMHGKRQGHGKSTGAGRKAFSSKRTGKSSKVSPKP